MIPIIIIKSNNINFVDHFNRFSCCWLDNVAENPLSIQRPFQYVSSKKKNKTKEENQFDKGEIWYVVYARMYVVYIYMSEKMRMIMLFCRVLSEHIRIQKKETKTYINIKNEKENIIIVCFRWRNSSPMSFLIVCNRVTWWLYVLE